MITSVGNEGELSAVRRPLWRIHRAANLKQLSFPTTNCGRRPELSVANVNDLIAGRVKNGRTALADCRDAASARIDDHHLLFRAGGIASRVGNLSGLIFPLPPHVSDRRASRRENQIG